VNTSGVRRARISRAAARALVAGLAVALAVTGCGGPPTARGGNTDSEPASWQIDTNDSAANAITSAGGVGLRSFISASADNLTYTYSFDDFMVKELP